MIELPNIIDIEDYREYDNGKIMLLSETYVILTHISNVAIYNKGGEMYARILHT